MDEQQALRRLKQGDLQSLETLVEIYQVRAVHAATLIVGDRGQAEDIVQDAFIRAWERIDQYDPRRPFGPWFLRSVVNDAIKTVTRQNRWVPLEQDAGEQYIDLKDPAPLPEVLFEAQETRQMVWEALQKIPPAERAAIALYYYLELPEQEIARRLQSPTGTIKWRLHSARQRLAKFLSSKVDTNEKRNIPPAGVQKSGEQK